MSIVTLKFQCCNFYVAPGIREASYAMNSSLDLCQIPAGPAPDGHSSFDNSATLAPVLIALTAITVAWGIIFTTTRFYINFRKLNWADYFNLIALLMSIAILGIEATLQQQLNEPPSFIELKAARHIWDLPACFFNADYAKGIYIPAVLLQFGAFFAKASIFLLFRQLFEIRKPMRIAIWIRLVFNFLLYATGIAVATYYETPRVGESWLDTLDGRTLIPLRWWQIQSALTVVLDLYIFILPLPIIARLKLPIRQRIQVIAVFSLAIMGIGASIASLVERIEITYASDTTWISAILSLCSAVELNVAIIVSSAPAFSSYARLRLANLSVVKILLSSFSSSSKSKSYSSEAELGMSGDRTAGTGDKVALNSNHRYYELNDRV
ncbi:hypothetical protein K449DRAFT_427565 [Hypoxylon sp. EC38]|nr:hypothetical protein K449DRAFT_427565 [Hypoxylon sp. EC38]